MFNWIKRLLKKSPRLKPKLVISDKIARAAAFLGKRDVLVVQIKSGEVEYFSKTPIIGDEDLNNRDFYRIESDAELN